MPALQRRQSPIDLRKAAHSASNERKILPMVKSNSQSSSDDENDLQTPKQLHIQAPGTMPVRYESDEELVSPIPDEFEDARTSFSDVDLDDSLDLDDDEIPSIINAISMPMKSVRPVLVNVSKLAPMEKRSTAAHVRSQMASNKTTFGRPIVARGVNGKNGPTVVTLSKPPSRAYKGPPPVPARSEARTPNHGSIPASVLAAAGQRPTFPPTEAATQRPTFPPRKDSHASRPSISTVASMTDDDDSSIADSSSSSAFSVADDADISARDQFLAEGEVPYKKHSISRSHDEDLQRAISDYMTWRAEGSPHEPTEETWRAATASAMGEYSPTQNFYAEGNGRRHAVDRRPEEDDEAWKREIKQGLATPTPTSYAAYDPFNVDQPTLKRQSDGFRMPTVREEIPRPSGPINGLRRGFGKVRRNL